MTDLQAREGVGALALEFTILTAARTGETIGARWPEIDFAAKVWTVPGERMKMGKEHRVPLTSRALMLLQKLRKVTTGDFIFGGKNDKPPSDMSMLMLLRRMGDYCDKDGREITVHGFRSTFRDWAYESSNFPREIVEAALAHAVGDETEKAYKRGDALEKRRKLMDAWAAYCAKPMAKGEVVSIATGRR